MPARAAYDYYKVVKGDTLSAIAKRYGTTVAEIAIASGIADPNKIKVGQELTIPVKADAPKRTAPASPGQATVIPAAEPEPRSLEQNLMDAANGLADWLRPPKLWVTLALAAGAGYYLLAPKKRNRQ
jgi:LysM repeat protein